MENTQNVKLTLALIEAQDSVCKQLPFLLKIRKKRLKIIYHQMAPRGVFKMGPEGKISFQIQSPQPLVAVFTDGSERRAGLGNRASQSHQAGLSKEAEFSTRAVK